MNLLRSLFGTPAAPAKVATSSRPRGTRPADEPEQVVKISLDAAQLLLRGGTSKDVQVDGPLNLETAPNGVLITARPRAQGAPLTCTLEIPHGATVDLDLATGGLTVHNFQGTLRARVLSGSVSVEHSEGRFRVVVPTGRVVFDRVRGEIDILTSNGSVAARQTHGGLQAVSTGGAMEFENIEGPLAARTISGSIHAKDLQGTARLSTRSGPVHVSGTCEQLKVLTHSGDIAVACSIVAHTTLQTFKGNLDIKLGPQTNAHLEAKVDQGVVRADRISPLPGSSRRTLRSTLGLGQSRLRIVSGVGVINVAGPPRVARPAATAND